MVKKVISQNRKLVEVETTKADGTTIKEQYVICEVCGQPNKLTNALCSKCSNYLQN
jgi:hypothetical protein